MAYVGTNARIWFLMILMHFCISAYNGKFCEQQGCKLATAESSTFATSAGGNCRSVHFCNR